ncbi:30S ribosomal protein S24e [Methanobrevibacter sp. DSM 116169]|uniref:30S ribosomal protein S24e n=1 Tax=Methanobrevibacter sp. DSM 116169 TaxID=3242727 RepID=UPI0038FBF109
MEIDIINQKDNKVLNRNEVKFVCDYEGEATPKILDVKSKLIALLNTKKNLIVIDSLQPHFGEAKALGYAKVYNTKDDLDYIETESVIAKNAEPEEEPVEEEAEEAPVEEETEAEE